MSDMASGAAHGCSWSGATLTGLMQHIVGRHHAFLRVELPAIDAILAQYTASRTKPRRDEKRSLLLSFREFRRELEGHLHKEEMVLFPLIASIESHVSVGQKPPRQPFGSIANPIGIMEQEHELARQWLRVLQSATDNAAGSFHAVSERLVLLESDLEAHSRLEDEVLFPRVIAMELR